MKGLRALAHVLGLLTALLFAGGCEDVYWAAVSPTVALVSGGSGQQDQTSSSEQQIAPQQTTALQPQPSGASSGFTAGAIPSIGGKWSGNYVNEETGYWEPVHATIEQDGGSIVIHTSFLGAGRIFTGTVDDSGHLRVFEADDGEQWTSRTPATRHSVTIQDFLYPPGEEEGDPMRVLDLGR